MLVCFIFKLRTGFNFAAVPASAATPASSVLEAAATAAKEPNQPEAFSLGGGMKFATVPETPFTFGGPKSSSLSAFGRASSGDPAALGTNGQAAETSLPFASAPKQGDPATQASAAGETLGSFSGLRVGQADENAKAAAAKGPSAGTATTPGFSVGNTLPASKPAEASPAALTTTAASATGSIFGNVQLVNPGPPSVFSLAAPAGGAKTPFAFGGPPVSAPQASSSSPSALPPSTPNLSFGGLLSAPATPAALATKEEEEARTSPAEKPPLADGATSPTAQVDPQVSVLAPPELRPAEVPPLATPLPPAEAGGGGQLTTPLEAAPSKDLSPASAPGEPKTEGLLLPEGPAGEQTSSTPPAPSSQLTEPTASPPTNTASVPAPANTTSAFTEAVATSPEFAPPSGLPSPPPPPPPPSSSSSTGSAFSQPATAGLTNPPAPPVFGQVSAAAALPVSSPFGQPPATPTSSSAAAAATGFNPSVFGTAAASGFGQSAFGQAPVFGQPTTPSSGFTFNQAGFGATPAFGQAASSAPPASSSGNVFGAASSTASSFSFGQPSTAAGLFVPSSAPVFGQGSSFGQTGAIFASPASMTTTTPTSSAGFSFCQASGKGAKTGVDVPPPESRKINGSLQIANLVFYLS